MAQLLKNDLKFWTYDLNVVQLRMYLHVVDPPGEGRSGPRTYGLAGELVLRPGSQGRPLVVDCHVVGLI